MVECGWVRAFRIVGSLACERANRHAPPLLTARPSQTTIQAIAGASAPQGVLCPSIPADAYGIVGGLATQVGVQRGRDLGRQPACLSHHAVYTPNAGLLFHCGPAEVSAVNSQRQFKQPGFFGSIGEYLQGL
jgi:hypothetical protein